MWRSLLRYFHHDEKTQTVMVSIHSDLQKYFQYSRVDHYNMVDFGEFKQNMPQAEPHMLFLPTILIDSSRCILFLKDDRQKRDATHMGWDVEVHRVVEICNSRIYIFSPMRLSISPSRTMSMHSCVVVVVESSITILIDVILSSRNRIDFQMNQHNYQTRSSSSNELKPESP